MRTPILLLSFLALFGSVDAFAVKGCPGTPQCSHIGCPNGSVPHCNGTSCTCKDVKTGAFVNPIIEAMKLKK